MAEPANPAELKAIAEECNESETDYETGLQMTFAVGGEGTTRCDFCIHWQGGLCDIYLDEKKEG